MHTGFLRPSSLALTKILSPKPPSELCGAAPKIEHPYSMTEHRKFQLFFGRKTELFTQKISILTNTKYCVPRCGTHNPCFCAKKPGAGAIPAPGVSSKTLFASQHLLTSPHPQACTQLRPPRPPTAPRDRSSARTRPRGRRYPCPPSYRRGKSARRPRPAPRNPSMPHRS